MLQKLNIKKATRKRIIKAIIEAIIKDNVFLKNEIQEEEINDFLSKSEEESSNNIKSVFYFSNYIVSEIQNKWNSYYPNSPLQTNSNEEENVTPTPLEKEKRLMCDNASDKTHTTTNNSNETQEFKALNEEVLATHTDVSEKNQIINDPSNEKILNSETQQNDNEEKITNNIIDSPLGSTHKNEQILIEAQTSVAENKLNETSTSNNKNETSLPQNTKGVSSDASVELVTEATHLSTTPTTIKINAEKTKTQVLTSNLPNAKVKENYDFTFTFDNDRQPSEISIPIGSGLSYEIKNETYRIYGTPKQAGDFVIKIACMDKKTKKTYNYNYSLIIVADPRDLWKDIPPDKTAPYFKENEDSKIIKGDNICIVAASKRGRSHAHKGSFRDDDFFVHHTPSGWSILIVCDGAGSAKYSREGSKLASQGAGEYLKSNLSEDKGDILDNLIHEWQKNNSLENQLKKELRDLLGYAIQAAIIKIEEAVRNKENVTAKDYSTTFLLAICRKQESGIFVASVGRGDGAIGVFHEESDVIEKCMFTPDAGEFSGQTHFLDRELGKSWVSIEKRIYFHLFTGSPIIFLMTDGISDPYFGAEANLMKYEYWKKLWLDVKPCLETPEADKALLNWLDFFVAGEHDDRTIAILR